MQIYITVKHYHYVSDGLMVSINIMSFNIFSYPLLGECHSVFWGKQSDLLESNSRCVRAYSILYHAPAIALFLNPRQLSPCYGMDKFLSSGVESAAYANNMTAIILSRTFRWYFRWPEDVPAHCSVEHSKRCDPLDISSINHDLLYAIRKDLPTDRQHTATHTNRVQYE